MWVTTDAGWEELFLSLSVSFMVTWQAAGPSRMVVHPACCRPLSLPLNNLPCTTIDGQSLTDLLVTAWAKCMVFFSIQALPACCSHPEQLPWP